MRPQSQMRVDILRDYGEWHAARHGRSPAAALEVS